MANRTITLCDATLACSNPAGAAAVDTSTASTLRLDLAVTAASGGIGLDAMAQHVVAPSHLVIMIETSPDGSTWRTLAERVIVSTQVPYAERLVLVGLDAYTRARWICRSAKHGESAAFSFSITGTTDEVAA